MSNPIEKLHSLGQSFWYDNIQRRLLEKGVLAAMIERGEIRGVTSNPSIFDNAISKSDDYDVALLSMGWAGLGKEEIFDVLALEDIRAAADLFRPLYEETAGGDGYVSLEVNPSLAYDTEASAEEAKRLWHLVDRPNLMVKIPATQEGLPAIREAIASGININVTLVFSLKRYAEVIAAYLSGLRSRREAGLPIDRIASVASFFVSRVDSKVDKRLAEIIRQEGPQAGLAAGLSGKAAVANAKLAYQQFLEIFDSEDFKDLQSSGARIQRPLWASTSTKNPAYSDVKYVEELIGPDTVNTVPQNTLDAYRDHGSPSQTLAEDVEGARMALQSLADLGISMQQVTQELEDEGVQAFAKSFEDLLETIEERRAMAQRRLAGLRAPLARRVAQLEAESVAQRMYSLDAGLWTEDAVQQNEIRERLGWLDLPGSSRALVSDLVHFADQVRESGYEQALLLGMGGSSLAAEVLGSFAFTGFLETSPGLKLRVLDSTDPAEVRAAADWTDARKTLYIVSSKSGGTAEVSAFFNYFWEKERSQAGEGSPENGSTGAHFIAITDPGTSLERLARERGFRRIFLADATVGGRNSALSAFGLVPAALLGIDLGRLLDRAAWMEKQCRPGEEASSAGVPLARNPGIVLGAALGEAALQGRDKLTLVSDQAVTAFGAWIEQLIAESTGKDGKGILPVDGEPVGSPEDYGSDRLFVYLRQGGEYNAAVERLNEAGHPVLVVDLQEAYDLGAEFYRWQVATATACAILGVNSFDQPDVQDSKTRTQEKLKTAGLPNTTLAMPETPWEKAGLAVLGRPPDGSERDQSLPGLLTSFLGQARPGDYIAINAFLSRQDEIVEQLNRLRILLRARMRLATTLGFGPRYLHSTGQMHKGGPDTGMFLHIFGEPEQDIPIPNQDGVTFGLVERAQALGDMEALQARGRRVLGIELMNVAALGELVDAVGK